MRGCFLEDFAELDVFFFAPVLVPGLFALFGARLTAGDVLGAVAAGATGGSPDGAADFGVSLFGFFGTGVSNSRTVHCRARRLQAIFAIRLHASRRIRYALLVRHFLFRWAVTTVAILVASELIPGIRHDTLASAVGAALLLGILNAFVRPILLLLGAPLILVTLGLFILLVNGLMLRWVPSFVPGFHVDTFRSAFWGALVVGLISWVLSAFFRGSDGRVHVLTHHSQVKRVQGRVVNPDDKG